MPRQPTILVRLPQAAGPMIAEIKTLYARRHKAQGLWDRDVPTSRVIMQALLELRDSTLMKTAHPTLPVPPHRPQPKPQPRR
jgi:hypothetical protein